MMPIRRIALLLTLAAAAAFLPACAAFKPAEVKPWERDILSRPSMQPDTNPTISTCDDHIYFSREASKGGRTYAGGGCGCN